MKAVDKIIYSTLLANEHSVKAAFILDRMTEKLKSYEKKEKS